MKLAVIAVGGLLVGCGGSGSNPAPSLADGGSVADAADAAADGHVAIDADPTVHETSCNDGLDDDDDNLIDCADPDCAQAALCEAAVPADPNRVTLGHECQGPLADPTMLARFIPSGMGTASFDHVTLSYRYQDCNPTTGCTPWYLFASGDTYGWYALRLDTTGRVHVSERAKNIHQAVRDAVVTAPELVIALGESSVSTGTAVQLHPTTVRMTNPTANQLCISFAQSVTSMNGATTHHDTHIAKVTLDAVPAPTTPPPFVPLNCTQGAATNTEVASWFTAGGTILSAQASLVRLGQTSCHPLTGCVATTRDGQLPRFAKPESLVVGTNGLAVRMLDWGLDQLVDRNLTAGTFDETGHDSDGVPWTLQGSTHLGRCIETMATGTYWHAWFWQSVALSEADRTSF